MLSGNCYSRRRLSCRRSINHVDERYVLNQCTHYHTHSFGGHNGNHNCHSIAGIEI